MDGVSNVSYILTIQSFDLSPKNALAAFLFATLSYMIILFCNLVLILTIVLNKSLHQPMYLLLLNLPINDLMGSTALFPQLINELLLDTKSIQYPACVTQAFFIHIYGVGSGIILNAMAYDRYIAICFPLRYNTIMSFSHIMKIILLIWLFNLIMIGVLFYLLLRLPRCRSLMTHSYCDNPSLLTLVCVDTTINNIYGLFTVALLQVVSVWTVLYSYMQIILMCFRNKGSIETKSKALQTCATHLTLFLLLESLGLLTIISYRVTAFPLQIRRLIGLSTLIFPPTFNPIIYGLKTTEIRVKIMHFFQRKIFPS